jgi:hypothetical protein
MTTKNELLGMIQFERPTYWHAVELGEILTKVPKRYHKQLLRLAKILIETKAGN